MVGALSHVKSNTIADFTGTITGYNSQGSTTTIIATNLVRPSDWNSVHQRFITISGNTAGSSTAASVTNLVLAGGDGLQLSMNTAANAATISIRQPFQTYFYPYVAHSTVTQTLGGQGVTSASAFFFPMLLDDGIQFNALRILMFNSWITQTSTGTLNVTSSWGIYTNNASTLSQISSGSMSMAMSIASVSATVSWGTATNTAGYTYSTTAVTTTAQAHSLFGTVGNRIVDMVFGNTMSLSAGLYWIGLMHRASSANSNVGISEGYVGNVMGAPQSAGYLGLASSANTTNFNHHPPGFGVYTSTGSAGYGGTALPTSVFLYGIAHTISLMPLVTFLST